jgi:RimJ/RimL family protein N-acetyltransferase
MSQDTRQELAKSVIGTRRLILRPLRESDAAAIFTLYNDWNVVRWLSSPPWPYTRADAESYVRAALDPTNEAAAIVFALKLQDRLIGSIGLRRRPASNLQSEAGLNIGYWLGTPYWRHGYMSEALRALVNHVFALTPAEAIYSGAFAGNRASLRVQEKAGFMRAGETMLFSRPNGRELAHVNTVLTRASLEFLAA